MVEVQDPSTANHAAALAYNKTGAYQKGASCLPEPRCHDGLRRGLVQSCAELVLPPTRAKRSPVQLWRSLNVPKAKIPHQHTDGVQPKVWKIPVQGEWRCFTRDCIHKDKGRSFIPTGALYPQVLSLAVEAAAVILPCALVLHGLFAEQKCHLKPCAVMRASNEALVCGRCLRHRPA